MSSNTVISFPAPPFSNPPIHPEWYNPNYFYISGVTLGQTTLVTTTANVNFYVGQLVRLLFPNGYGCGQLNEKTALVSSIPAPNQVVLELFSLNADAFRSSSNPTQPTIVPVGDINTGRINAGGPSDVGLSILGSFVVVS